MTVEVIIVDYDAGNLRNVQKAVEYLGCKGIISNDGEVIKRGSAYILPGVGAFHDGMDMLEKLGLHTILFNETLQNKKPILGICLGMHLLGEKGFEGGGRNGLGILPMSAKKLDSHKSNIRLPHMGWNAVNVRRDSVLFNGIPDNSDFYFAHSYYADCGESLSGIAVAYSDYGEYFPVSVEKNNVFATQFHPEKSQRYGLKVLENYLLYCNKEKR